jgi:hypothetical protein
MGLSRPSTLFESETSARECLISPLLSIKKEGLTGWFEIFSSSVISIRRLTLSPDAIFRVFSAMLSISRAFKIALTTSET